MSEVLLRDIHPGEIALPDGTVITRARVFVTTERVLAFTAAGREISRDLDLPCDTRAIPAHHGTLGRGHLEAFTEHGTVLINRGSGCSCGPLASMMAPVPWRAR